MSNIEEIIENSLKNEIEIPTKIIHRINYTLNNKRKKVNYFRRFVLAVVSTICTIIGTFGVYAVTGGTIEGIPVTDWLGIKFSSNYINYKQVVENQGCVFENTSVELVSTLCSEGITILEFDLKISKEDYEKFRIGQNSVTEKFLEQIENNKKNISIENIVVDLKDKKYYEELNNGNTNILIDDINVSQEEIDKEYEKRIEKINELLEERENTFVIPALSLNYDEKGGTYNYDKFNPNTDWYASIYIDDEPYYVQNFQKTEKINDYEYKIYTMYMITDDVLEGKNDFKITLKNNKLVSRLEWKNVLNGWTSGCQHFARYFYSEEFGLEKTNVTDLPKDFEIVVSKNEVLKDSLVLENPGIKSEFRNITQTVEKVVCSPFQTIVRINHSATQQSSNVFANKYQEENIEHLPITKVYKVYDASGNELSCFSTSNKNTLIYSDGTREDYDTHDVPNKTYSNATWETIEYLLIEKTQTDYIKIVPVELIQNPVDGNEDVVINGYEMEPLIINLK